MERTTFLKLFGCVPFIRKGDGELQKTEDTEYLYHFDPDTHEPIYYEVDPPCYLIYAPDTLPFTMSSGETIKHSVDVTFNRDGKYTISNFRITIPRSI